MKQTTYETPVMTEFEMLAEQTFLSNSMVFSADNTPAQVTGRVNIWGNEDL